VVLDSRLVRTAVLGMMAARKFKDAKTVGGGHTDLEKERLQKEVDEYKAEAEKVGSRACLDCSV
jgi:phosphosulfolactate synthase (CoM biosynthesis protein A)